MSAAAAKAGTKLNISSTIRLASGYEMPVLGFGVYQTPAQEAARCVSHAIKTGYRHVDSAAAYRNEAPCASALLASGLPRSSYFFTSKVAPRNISYEGARDTVNETLKLCEGIDYIDLMLLHAPYGGKTNRLGAWDALTEAVRAGKVRSIGVSNYGVHHLEELWAHIQERNASSSAPDNKDINTAPGGVLSINQVELHPWLSRPDIVSWCRAHNVILQAYSPLTRATRFEEATVQAACKQTGKTPAQVLVRWSLEMGFVPLPKSVTEARIEENARVFGWELGDKEVMALDAGVYEPCAWDPTVSRD